MDRPAPFGRPGCVTWSAVKSIEDDALKAEAILLARETGVADCDMARALGMESAEIARLELAQYQPYRRQGETT